MLIKIVTRKYEYREKNGNVWALFFRRYRRLTVQELSIMKCPFGSSEKDTDAHTHTVAILQLQEQRVWSELIAFPPRKVSWLMSVWPWPKKRRTVRLSCRDFPFSYITSLPLCYRRLLRKIQHGNSASVIQCSLSSIFMRLSIIKRLNKTALLDPSNLLHFLCIVCLC